MKKISIIGANSYIARNIIFTMQHNIYNFDLRLYDYAEKQVDNAPNYSSVNILSKESVSSIDMNCDLLFMFVGKTGSNNGFEDFDTYININEISLLNVLNECTKQKSKAKIIFPSTRLVYKGKKGRLCEEAEKEYKTIYAINKFACEMYLKQFHNLFNGEYCIFRICVPYGTLIEKASSYGTAEFMISKARNGENISLYGDGSQRRTLTYMGDLCDILIAGALSDQCRNEIFNVGGGDYSLNEMATLIAKKYGVCVEYTPWPEIAQKVESGDTVFDDTKLKKAINCVYKKTFEDWIWCL